MIKIYYDYHLTESRWDEEECEKYWMIRKHSNKYCRPMKFAHSKREWYKARDLQKEFLFKLNSKAKELCNWDIEPTQSRCECKGWKDIYKIKKQYNKKEKQKDNKRIQWI